jgi:hypothetical protein
MKLKNHTIEEVLTIPYNPTNEDTELIPTGDIRIVRVDKEEAEKVYRSNVWLMRFD